MQKIVRLILGAKQFVRARLRWWACTTFRTLNEFYERLKVRVEQHGKDHEVEIQADKWESGLDILARRADCALFRDDSVLAAFRRLGSV